MGNNIFLQMKDGSNINKEINVDLSNVSDSGDENEDNADKEMYQTVEDTKQKP